MQILAGEDYHGSWRMYRRFLLTLGQDGHTLDGDRNDSSLRIYPHTTYTDSRPGLRTQ